MEEHIVRNWEPYERIGAALDVAIKRSQRAGSPEVGRRYLEQWNKKYGNETVKRHLLSMLGEWELETNV